MAPLFTSFYFASMGVMEGASRDEIRERLRHGLGPTLLANYAIFPLAQGINFAFVPLQLQVLVLNAGGLAYNVVLSKYNAEGKKQKVMQQQRQTEKQQPQQADKLPIATAAETAGARRKRTATTAATADAAS